jgi:hypothetical protein
VKNAGWVCGLHKSRSYSVTFPGEAIYFSRFSRTNDRKFNSINYPTVVTTTVVLCTVPFTAGDEFSKLSIFLCNRSRNERFAYLKQAAKSKFAAVAFNDGR